MKSLVATAPVCDEAALLPADEYPDFMAAILHPLLIKDDACFKNFRGLVKLSM